MGVCYKCITIFWYLQRLDLYIKIHILVRIFLISRTNSNNSYLLPKSISEFMKFFIIAILPSFFCSYLTHKSDKKHLLCFVFLKQTLFWPSFMLHSCFVGSLQLYYYLREYTVAMGGLFLFLQELDLAKNCHLQMGFFLSFWLWNLFGNLDTTVNVWALKKIRNKQW